MYMSHAGRDIVFAIDSQEEAKAILAVLTGTPAADEKAWAFGQNAYTFFFQAVQKLATDFEKEVKGIHPFPHNPKKGRKDTL